MKTFIVILTLSNGVEVVEPASYADCQHVFRQLRYYDALGQRMLMVHPQTGARATVESFECRPAASKDGAPTS